MEGRSPNRCRERLWSVSPTPPTGCPPTHNGHSRAEISTYKTRRLLPYSTSPPDHRKPRKPAAKRVHRECPPSGRFHLECRQAKWKISPVFCRENIRRRASFAMAPHRSFLI